VGDDVVAKCISNLKKSCTGYSKRRKFRGWQRGRDEGKGKDGRGGEGEKGREEYTTGLYNTSWLDQN